MTSPATPIKLPHWLGFWVGGSWEQLGNDWLGSRSTSLAICCPGLRWRTQSGGGGGAGRGGRREGGREREKGGGEWERARRGRRVRRGQRQLDGLHRLN